VSILRKTLDLPASAGQKRRATFFSRAFLAVFFFLAGSSSSLR